jgi:hypothetical protein
MWIRGPINTANGRYCIAALRDIRRIAIGNKKVIRSWHSVVNGWPQIRVQMTESGEKHATDDHHSCQ